MNPLPRPFVIEPETRASTPHLVPAPAYPHGASVTRPPANEANMSNNNHNGIAAGPHHTTASLHAMSATHSMNAIGNMHGYCNAVGMPRHPGIMQHHGYGMPHTFPMQNIAPNMSHTRAHQRLDMIATEFNGPMVASTRAQSPPFVMPNGMSNQTLPTHTNVGNRPGIPSTVRPEPVSSMLEAIMSSPALSRPHLSASVGQSSAQSTPVSRIHNNAVHGTAPQMHTGARFRNIMDSVVERIVAEETVATQQQRAPGVAKQGPWDAQLRVAANAHPRPTSEQGVAGPGRRDAHLDTSKPNSSGGKGKENIDTSDTSVETIECNEMIIDGKNIPFVIREKNTPSLKMCLLPVPAIDAHLLSQYPPEPPALIKNRAKLLCYPASDYERAQLATKMVVTATCNLVDYHTFMQFYDLLRKHCPKVTQVQRKGTRDAVHTRSPPTNRGAVHTRSPPTNQGAVHTLSPPTNRSLDNSVAAANQTLVSTNPATNQQSYNAAVGRGKSTEPGTVVTVQDPARTNNSLSLMQRYTQLAPQEPAPSTGTVVERTDTGRTDTGELQSASAAAAGRASLETGWLQINNAVVPYVRENSAQYLPKCVIDYVCEAEFAQEQCRVCTLDESRGLNTALSSAGIDVIFEANVTLVIALDVVKRLRPHIYMRALPKDNPLDHARALLPSPVDTHTDSDPSTCTQAPAMPIDPSATQDACTPAKRRRSTETVRCDAASKSNADDSREPCATSLKVTMRRPSGATQSWSVVDGTCQSVQSINSSARKPSTSFVNDSGNSDGDAVTSKPLVYRTTLRDKAVSVLERGKHKFVLLEVVVRVFFSFDSIDLIEKKIVGKIKKRLQECTPQEEQAFIEFYKLETSKLHSNKLVKFHLFEKYLDYVKDCLHAHNNINVPSTSTAHDRKRKQATVPIVSEPITYMFKARTEPEVSDGIARARKEVMVPLVSEPSAYTFKPRNEPEVEDDDVIVLD